MSKFEWIADDVTISRLPQRLQKIVDRLSKRNAAKQLQTMIRTRRITPDDLKIIIESGALNDA